MPKIDAYEREIVGAYEKGKLASVATKAELARLKAAARATAIKDRRGNWAQLPARGLSGQKVHHFGNSVLG